MADTERDRLAQQYTSLRTELAAARRQARYSFEHAIGGIAVGLIVGSLAALYWLHLQF